MGRSSLGGREGGDGGGRHLYDRREREDEKVM